MSIVAIVILLGLGVVLGSVFTVLAIRKLGRASRHSEFWQGLFCRSMAFRIPRTNRVVEITPPSEPKETEPDTTLGELGQEESPQGGQLHPVWIPSVLDTKQDDDKVIASVLRGQGFRADETQKAISVVRATIPYGTLESKIFAALRSRGAGIW